MFRKPRLRVSASTCACVLSLSWTLTACSGAGETPADGGSAPDIPSQPAADLASDGLADRTVDLSTGGVPEIAGAPETGGAPESAGAPETGADLAPQMPTEYNPCPPAGTPCRIMPLGDSITHGIGSTTLGGYRIPLFRKALAAKHSLTFVGSVQTGPATVDGVPFPRQHEGHRAFVIDTVGSRAGLSPLVPAAIATHKPHIVTLMIGTNDTALAAYAPEAPRRLGELIDKIIVADPNVLIVVAQLIPQVNPAGNERVIALNKMMPAVVAARTAMQKHVVLVDLYQAIASQPNYQTTMMTDGLHPNDAGYEKMGDVWWTVVGPLLR